MGYMEELEVSYPTEFDVRKCKICREDFKPIYFNNLTCHVCREKGFRGELVQTEKEWLV